MKKILFALAVLTALVSCKNSGDTLLPNVSGKAGEVVVVIDKDNWEGSLGNEVRSILACDCPYLVQPEPLYSLVNVTPGAFGNLFHVHRNILIFNINSQLDSAGVIYKHDVWSRPQCVIQVNGRDAEEALATLNAKQATILASIEQAERDRVIANSIKYEEYEATAAVREVFGGAPRIPIGYKLRKITNDFAWIADEKQYSTQGVFVYRYPVEGTPSFSAAELLEKRNEMLKANVPGAIANSYMTTSEFVTPTVQYLKYKGRDLAEMRGYWEVQNDYMGGPFVSHYFYSEDGQYIIVLDAWIYAPKYDKRQYLRQTESILYSWEWNKKEEGN